MKYILQHSYKKEYINFNDEIHGRQEYLYDLFKIYFIIKKTCYKEKSFCAPDYYVLESFPSVIFKDFIVIVGDTNFVVKYINMNKDTFGNKKLILITCKKGYLSFFKKLHLLKCDKIFIAKTTNDEVDYYDGSKWGFDFKITLSELDFYNSNEKNLIKRLSESFERIK